MLLSELTSEDKILTARLLSLYLVHAGPDGIIELLPSDNHALSYPLTFKPLTSEVIRGKVNFYNQGLFRTYTEAAPVKKEAIRWSWQPAVKDKCLIINLLDNCYGHSLLKMFSLPLIEDKYGEQADLIVITPASLMPFLPVQRLITCEVGLSFREMNRCVDLSEIMMEVSSRYRAWDFAFLNTYEPFHDADRLCDYFGFPSPAAPGSPARNIVFYYRRDPLRRWGGVFQKYWIIRLFKRLRPYFGNEVHWVVLGEKDRGKFPGFIQDLRTSSFTPETERQYVAVLSESMMVFGVHGSHLILPSLLSRVVIHLVPPYKRKNTAEDMVNVIQDSVPGFYRNIQVQTVASLMAPAPSGLFRLALDYFASYAEKCWKKKASGEEVPLLRGMDQKQYIRQEYPHFNYDKACRKRETMEKWSLRMHRLFNLKGS